MLVTRRSVIVDNTTRAVLQNVGRGDPLATGDESGGGERYSDRCTTTQTATYTTMSIIQTDRDSGRTMNSRLSSPTSADVYVLLLDVASESGTAA